MKTFKKTYLPDSINYNNDTYNVNIDISGAMRDNKTPINAIAATLKKEGRKSILVYVLSNNLKGRTDLYGKPYQPSKWIFTTDNK